MKNKSKVKQIVQAGAITGIAFKRIQEKHDRGCFWHDVICSYQSAFGELYSFASRHFKSWYNGNEVCAKGWNAGGVFRIVTILVLNDLANNRIEQHCTSILVGIAGSHSMV
jgi:hypothetical protein